MPVAEFAIRPAPGAITAVTGFAASYLVFAALPLLAGRYVAQQRAAAEQERLRERLRIARDMHDSLGRRLSIAAGAVVSLRSRGAPRALSPRAGEAAYRVIEEGLTNAIRHSPGQPVSVEVVWEARSLVLTVANVTDDGAYTPGSGLADLAGRLRHAGGLLTHDLSGGQFRPRAALPANPPPGIRNRSRVSALGLAAGTLLLVILPAAILLGAR